MNTRALEVKTYRCYLLDESKSIKRATAFELVSDDEARCAAFQWFALPDNRDGAGFELWRESSRLMVHLCDMSLSPAE